MKFIKTLPLFLISISLLSTANAVETKKTEPVDLKDLMINSCIDDTVKFQITDKKTASKLCSCSINVRGKMTLEQMWQAQSYAQNGINPIELPFIKAMQTNIQQCGAGFTLNKPQQPTE